MGLENRNTNLKYVKVVNGKFYLTTDKGNTTPYDSLQGVVTDIGIKLDEYQGQKIKKLYLTLRDGDDSYVLSVGFASSWASSIISFLKSADLKQPLTLIPSYKKEKDKEDRKVFVSQNDSYLKSFYTKDKPNGLPAFKQVRLNGEDKYDKTDYLEFLENVVVNELRPQTKGTVVAEKPKVKAETPVMSDDTSDDLPF